MTDTNNNSENNELVLEDVVQVAPEDLSDPQKTFLQDNVDNLSDDQKKTFSDVIKKEGGDEGDEKGKTDPDDVKIATRGKIKKEEEKGDKGDEGDEGSEVDPADEKTIKKVVRETLEEAGVGSTKDQVEIDAFIRSKPEYEKYRGLMLKYASDPSHKNVAIHNIAAIVSAEDQQKIGAQRERDATKKAKDTGSPGTSARKPEGETKNWANATKEEYDAKRAEVLQRQGD